MRAWGHHRILPLSLAPPGRALQQDDFTSILGKPLAPAALMKSPESPAYGGSGNSLAPGGEGLAGAASRAARAVLPHSEDGGCGVGMQHTECLHTHPCTPVFARPSSPSGPSGSTRSSQRVGASGAGNVSAPSCQQQPAGPRGPGEPAEPPLAPPLLLPAPDIPSSLRPL